MLVDLTLILARLLGLDLGQGHGAMEDGGL
jgi:hypothetical protein